jgi:ABC-2 type transport system permease protein
MGADVRTVAARALRDQRRGLALWALALAAVTSIYVSFYPAMGDASDIQAFVANLPEGIVQAMGYDDMASPAGYLRSTVYGLLGPALLLVFAIGTGARLVAGQEEDRTLELELTAPVSRRAILVGRLLALWAGVALLTTVVVGVTLALAAGLDIDVAIGGVLAAGTGLLLLVLGLGTVALAVGAATGRRTVALAAASGLAVAAFMLNALAPALDADWMQTVSPFSWYLEPNPLAAGADAGDLTLLAAVPIVAALAGLLRFERRDLLV